VDLNGIQDAISNGEYRFKAADGEKPLPVAAKLSSVWQRPWPSDSDDHPQLHVYVTLPADMGSPTLFQVPSEYFIHRFVSAQDI
jgi:hypothetical protein